MIHRLWGGKPIPDRYVEYGRQWQIMNPTWDVVTWDIDDLLREPWMNQKVIDDIIARDDGENTVEKWVQLADVMSYELLYRHGGVYINVDIEPIRPLTHLAWHGVAQDEAWLAREDEAFVVNAAMGCVARDDFFMSVIAALPLRYFGMGTREMNQTTGPRLITDLWQAGGKVKPLPVDTFNPVHWRDVKLGEYAKLSRIPDGTIGLHHWGHRLDDRSNVIEIGVSRARDRASL